jgi:hypothetical protein
MRNRNYGRRRYPRRQHEPPLIETLAELVFGLVRSAGARIFRLFKKPPVPVQPEPLELDEVSPFQPRPWRTVPASLRSSPEVPAESRSPQPRTSYKSGSAPLPYIRATALLTKGERAFWHPLLRAIDGRYRLFCKVRLADVVRCPPDRRDEGRWFRKIGRYHVDFVVCDSKTTAPLLVIELDDRGHRERIRRDRDSFKDAVLKAAGIPILRVPAQHAYDAAALKAEVCRLLNGQRPSASR